MTYPYLENTECLQDTEKVKDKDRLFVVLNKSAVLHEIEHMGRGVVKQITVHV